MTIDGVPQRIADFQPANNLPLYVAILIDKSGSQKQALSFSTTAANMLVTSQILSGNNRVAVVSFGDTSLEQHFTSNLEDVDRAIDHIRLSTEGGPTALYDALWVTCEKLCFQARANINKSYLMDFGD